MADGVLHPCESNRRYWAYDDRPMLLLGGSREDNLFQIPDLEAHLEKLAAAGGNYVRCTMSSRGSRGSWTDDIEQDVQATAEHADVWPFTELDDGRYDLDTWNPEYWDRFDRFLEATRQRDIVPQIGIWALHDFYRFGPWGANPWNPENNVTYDTEETTLQTEGYGSFWDARHDFFLTVPELQDDEVVLAYQERFVDKLLSHTLAYDHVLYTITNEIFSQFDPEWGWYWAEYLKDAAAQNERTVYVTEMYQGNDFSAPQHRAALDHPERFDFFEASQNAGNARETHWQNLAFVHQYLGEEPRPINHVKSYGGRTHWTDGPDQGIERFWRSIIGGAASIRFHRPPAGIGLSERATYHIQSARQFEEAFDLLSATPDADHSLLSNRDSNEAYLSVVEGEQFAVYFPDGGSVSVDLGSIAGPIETKWLHLEGAEWHTTEEDTVAPETTLPVEAPHLGHWIAIVSVVDEETVNHRDEET